MPHSPLAVFRFEASPAIGAGHAIRSCVLADALIEKGFSIKIVTSLQSYHFLTHLTKYERISPKEFFEKPFSHDVLVIDHYDLDHVYERHFRPFAKKILVLDDLANRNHDCDVLVDQTFQRTALMYKYLVPQSCRLLIGCSYALIRHEFTRLRKKSLEKREKTHEVQRILVSMGGSDPKNYTQKAIILLKKTGFKGKVDIVTGFSPTRNHLLEQELKDFKGSHEIHVNPPMAELMYASDLSIGAAGSSVWERCCLGLPSLMYVTANNQKLIYKNLIDAGICFKPSNLTFFLKEKINMPRSFYAICDGEGYKRILDVL